MLDQAPASAGSKTKLHKKEFLSIQDRVKHYAREEALALMDEEQSRRALSSKQRYTEARRMLAQKQHSVFVEEIKLNRAVSSKSKSDIIAPVFKKKNLSTSKQIVSQQANLFRFSDSPVVKISFDCVQQFNTSDNRDIDKDQIRNQQEERGNGVEEDS